MGLRNASSISIVSAMIALTLSTSAHAQPKKAAKATAPAPKAEAAAPTPAPAGPVAQPGAPKADDKVDLSDLENKYWAPKDTDFSVVQNRTYSKTGRFMLTPGWGMPINDPYSEGSVFGLTANYFWSERMGVQLTYLSANLKNNDATNDIGRLSSTSGAMPDHGKFQSHYSVGYNFVPFYAKMSFWNKRIIYFDMAFTPHVGMTQYEQQIEFGNKVKSELSYGIDVTQLFFFSKIFAIRVDLKNMWHHEDVVKFRTTGPDLKGAKVRDINTQDTLFLIGPTFYW